MLFVRKGIGLVEVVIGGRGRMARATADGCRRGSASGRRGAARIAVRSGFRIGTAIQTLNVIGHDLHDTALAPVLRDPGTGLQAAVYGDQTPFGQVVGSELGGPPPRDNIEEI